MSARSTCIHVWGGACCAMIGATSLLALCSIRSVQSVPDPLHPESNRSFSVPSFSSSWRADFTIARTSEEQSCAGLMYAGATIGPVKDY